MTMDDFMNSLYNAVGSEVSGVYDGVAFLGTITETRVKYGTDVRVTVVDGSNTYLINGTELMAGDVGLYKNLHVYFK
jgi:hypothetical protein